jgi:hypothetical protein
MRGLADVIGPEDWDEMEYLSGDHPSYTRVYKMLTSGVSSSH